ncbi:MAG: hypothetical protein J5614_06570 [Paludibacteraceae bacterium]|nr:hypothetical protein [Paludibacteraceae bacterium]
MSTVKPNEPVKLSQYWGDVKFSDFEYGKDANGNTRQVDFQDLMVEICNDRAVTVEGEVTPLVTRIKKRNTDLDTLGEALADLTRQQAAFKSDAKGDDRSGTTVSSTTLTTLHNFFSNTSYIQSANLTKKENEYCIQLVKSKIDSLNNDSQSDMSRLESLVDRRDESYSTASSLMSSISDTRTSLISNLS